MSRKKTRKRRGGKAGNCLACGNRLRRHDPACKRCGQRSPLVQPKSARPFLVKSASGNVVPLRRPLCWAGHPCGRWDRYCHRCGEPVGVSREQSAAMAQKALSGGGYYDREAALEADPGKRAVLEKMARAQPGYRGADPLTIALAMGYRGLEDAARRETSPMYRQMFEQAWLSPGSGGGAA